MPAEILNWLRSILPETEASVTNESIGPSMKAEPLQKLKAEMRAMKFLWNLPIISMDRLQWDEQYCGLCKCKYDDEFKVCQLGESPCCLPCGHIAGHKCLRAHLSPFESGFTKCPFCHVHFPQMFTDPVEPAQPTSGLAWADIKEPEEPDEDLIRKISQLSNDSGATNDEIKRFLSIGEVLERSRIDTQEMGMNTKVRDFAAETIDSAKVGEGEFPKNREKAVSPTIANAARKDVDLIAKNF